MAQKLMREMFRLSFGEEVGNAVSHGVMAVITFILLPLFAVYSSIQGGVIRAAGTSIYLMCMFFMFLTSTIYHSMSYGSPQKYVFRKLDHIAILFAIAGSYTPVCLSLIQGTSGIVILIIEWSMVLAGVLLKAIAKRSYPILSMVIYMVMGWCAVFFLPTLLQRAQPLFLVFIVLGGLMYTAGAFFYAHPKHAYFHFIWHLFINLASICHFIALIFFI